MSARARRAVWHLSRAAEALFSRSRPHIGTPSTADWHQPVPSGHPSLLCKCGDVLPDEHRPGCEWAAQMCKMCEGDGTCPDCRGDGISTGNEIRSAHDERSAVVAFIRALVDKEQRGNGLVRQPQAVPRHPEHAAFCGYAARVLSLLADNLEIGAHTSTEGL